MARKGGKKLLNRALVQSAECGPEFFSVRSYGNTPPYPDNIPYAE